MQSAAERSTAESVRLILRRGVDKMLDNMQKQRANEPTAVSANAEELKKLIKVGRTNLPCSLAHRNADLNVLQQKLFDCQ